MDKYINMLSQIELHKQAVLYDFFNIFHDLKILNVKIINNICSKIRAVVTFEQEKRVIYENTQLGLERGFGKYIGWINQNIQCERKLYQKSILIYSDCSFLEYISYHQPSCEKQLKDYYLRFGSLAALLLSLNGEALLPSMVIPMGSQPVIQDVTSLFHSCPTYNKNLPEYGEYHKILGGNIISKYETDIRKGYERFYTKAKENENDIKEIVKLCFMDALRKC